MMPTAKLPDVVQGRSRQGRFGPWDQRIYQVILTSDEGRELLGPVVRHDERTGWVTAFNKWTESTGQTATLRQVYLRGVRRKGVVERRNRPAKRRRRVAPR
jgi:hypothetical protein